MTRRPPTRRGVTLTEVLVALFVMALGMTALLTLFPLGAFQIGQALKDDRCTQTALQADGFIRAHWRHQIAARSAAQAGQPYTGVPNNFLSFVWGMDDPNLAYRRVGMAWQNTYVSPPTGGSGFYLPTGVTIPDTTAGRRVSPTSLTSEQYQNPPGAAGANTFATTPFAGRSAGRSHPVLLDPIGVLARGATNPESLWVGRSSFPAAGSVPLVLVPRRNLGGAAGADPYLPTLNAAFAQCFLTDDMAFEGNGAPQAVDPTTGLAYPNGAVLQRQGRYSWAALIQRPHNDRPATADLTVLVFDGRPSFTVPAGDEFVARVVQPGASGNPNPNGETWAPGSRTAVVTVPSRTPEQVPLVRKGGWVLDATIRTAPMPPPWGSGPTGPTPPALPPDPLPAKFYRIVGLTELAVNPPPGTTTYALDLDAPIATAPPPGEASQLYFFANLAEVFPRPQLTPDDR